MGNIEVRVRLEPPSIRPNIDREVAMSIELESKSESEPYWCECDVEVEPPLSLAPHKDLESGRKRLGIIKPKSGLSQRINIYADITSFPNNYTIKLITYVYDADGAISERLETLSELRCGDESTMQVSEPRDSND